jgi:hypothetical protein
MKRAAFRQVSVGLSALGALLHLLCATQLASAGNALSAARVPARADVPLPELAAHARRALRASAVPVLLPRSIPAEFGPVRSIAVIDSGASGYYIGLSPVRTCLGALSCAFIHVAGRPTNARAERSPRRAQTVRLSDGTRAVYVPRDCSGASCTEASLLFERSAATYEIDAQAGCDGRAALERIYRRLRIVR